MRPSRAVYAALALVTISPTVSFLLTPFPVSKSASFPVVSATADVPHRAGCRYLTVRQHQQRSRQQCQREQPSPRGHRSQLAGSGEKFEGSSNGDHAGADKSRRRKGSRVTLAASAVQATGTEARPPLPADFYEESLLDKVALGLFRMLVQKQIGYKSEEEGYAGLIDEAQNYMVVQGATVQEQQDMVVRVLSTIAGPAVPPIYKLFMAPWPWAPFLTAFFTPPFFKFLVGPNKLDVRKDETLGGVFVERCRFLEETNCKGLCTNMCKIPTERFFEETLGMTMAMEPDFDTYECRLSFGLTSPTMEEDETVPTGCLSGCSCKELGAKVATTCSKQ